MFKNHHEEIIKIFKPLGYNERRDGCCHGVTVKWLESVLTKNEAKFIDRIETIYQNNPPIPDLINCIKEKVNSNIPISRVEKNNLEILGFIEGILLNQIPQEYDDIFTEYLSQLDVDQVSQLASCQKIKAQGGLATVYSMPNILSSKNIAHYLDDIRKTLDTTQESPFTFLVHSDTHAVGMAYTPKVGWRFLDINQWPPKSFEVHQVNELANALMFGLKDPIERINNSINNLVEKEHLYAAFNTKIIVEASRYEQVKGTFNALRKKHCDHAIALTVKRQDEEVDLAYMAVCFNHVDVIRYLVERKINFHINRPRNNDFLLFRATENSNMEMVNLLLEQGAAPNTRSPVVMDTPLHRAIRVNKIALASLLLEKGASPDLANGEHHSPLFMATLFHHKSMVKLLMKYNANVQSCSIVTRKYLQDIVNKLPNGFKECLQQWLTSKLVNEEQWELNPLEIAEIMGPKYKRILYHLKKHESNLLTNVINQSQFFKPTQANIPTINSQEELKNNIPEKASCVVS